MSRRRKGPAWPPHQQHNPFPAPARPTPKARAVLVPLPHKHEIFLHSEAPPRSLC